MRIFVVLGVLGLFFTLSANAQEEAQEKKELVSVTAKNIKLDVPASWKKRETSSNMRAAEFEIPAAQSGEESAELVVYHFGGPTGGTKANIQRWIDQFHEDGRQHDLVGGQSREGKYVWVTLTGTYKKPDGPPAAQKTIDKPNSRVIGVVLISELDGGEDYYFLKLAGPDAVVAAEVAALRTALGVDPSAEKPVKLDELAD